MLQLLFPIVIAGALAGFYCIFFMSGSDGGSDHRESGKETHVISVPVKDSVNLSGNGDDRKEAADPENRNDVNGVSGKREKTPPDSAETGGKDEVDSPENRNTADGSTQKKNTEQIDQEGENKNVDPLAEKVQQLNRDQASKESRVYDGTIIFESRKYGVNWNVVESGVQISRISKGGAFFIGGIKVGDILTEVNGRRITNGNELNLAREQLFAASIGKIEMKVLRGDKPLMFVLKKLNSFKLFEGSILKTRSSHPNEKDNRWRWRFLKVSQTVKIKAGERVFIAGDIKGEENWAVDDTLMINGVLYNGIREGDGQGGALISDDRKLPPLEITDLIKPGRNVVLNIALANHGILFGNTAIYIVIK